MSLLIFCNYSDPISIPLKLHLDVASRQRNFQKYRHSCKHDSDILWKLPWLWIVTNLHYTTSYLLFRHLHIWKKVRCCEPTFFCCEAAYFHLYSHKKALNILISKFKILNASFLYSTCNIILKITSLSTCSKDMSPIYILATLRILFRPIPCPLPDFVVSGRSLSL